MMYVTPEAIMNDVALQSVLTTHGVARIVVDEAHCIVAWRYDFRPEYARLGELRSMFPGVGVTALTGTTTPSTRKSIKSMLGMQNETVFIKSCYRRNLEISVEI
jgi:superfamily II DNA helicase RecQ